MKPVVLHCEADAELSAVAKRYKCEKPVRRARVPGFPYRLIYEELGDCIHVLAIMHDSREPGYWKSRLS